MYCASWSWCSLLNGIDSPLSLQILCKILQAITMVGIIATWQSFLFKRHLQCPLSFPEAMYCKINALLNRYMKWWQIHILLKHIHAKHGPAVNVFIVFYFFLSSLLMSRNGWLLHCGVWLQGQTTGVCRNSLESGNLQHVLFSWTQLQLLPSVCGQNL